MSISLLLEMAVSADPDRVAVVCEDVRLTTAQLKDLADGGSGVIRAANASSVAYVGLGGAMLPTLLFSAAQAAAAFTPLNYRLGASALRALIERLPAPLVVADAEYQQIVAGNGVGVVSTEQFIAAAGASAPMPRSSDPDDAAVVLFTSGTTSSPKAVELSHNNLTSYITGTVDFASAGPEDAALICVPPYHIAGIGAALSNLYAGRRMVYLPQFDARRWIELINAEAATTATVVPTMLDRIVNALQNQPTALPSLRNLAYGGSKIPLPLIRTALDLLPDVGFVNAYGLTETSSTVAVLTPDDHRRAHHSADEDVRRRLGSVGRPVHGIETEIRDEAGTVVGPGHIGELFLRGDQVSGRYTGIGSVLDQYGWFPTRDRAMLDDAGYLFITGRIDDTIIRGGENIAPAELEDVLVEHPAVREVAVVGVDDDEWGQAIAAVIVPQKGARPNADELRAFVRGRLRGSRTPDRVVFWEALPTNATGKVLRRAIVEELNAPMARQ